MCFSCMVLCVDSVCEVSLECVVCSIRVCKVNNKIREFKENEKQDKNRNENGNRAEFLDQIELIKSNFAEHIFYTHHTFTDIETNLEILHTLPKGPKLNTTEQYEIYKCYKQSPTNILNDQIHYKSHTLLTQSCTAATITSLLTQQPRTGTSQPVPPGPSSIENDAHGIENFC